MRYKAKKIKYGEQKGKWAVWKGKKYYISTITDKKIDAQYTAIAWTAHYHQSQIDECDEAMDKLGLLDHYDPSGYRC